MPHTGAALNPAEQAPENARRADRRKARSKGGPAGPAQSGGPGSRPKTVSATRLTGISRPVNSRKAAAP